MTNQVRTYSSPFSFFDFKNREQVQTIKKSKLSCEKLVWNINKASKSISPMINGNNVSLEKAISEAKKIIRNSKEIHLDGFSCDQNSIIDLFQFVQRKMCSCNHLEWKKISNFYINFQRYGGAFSSLNEIANRCDFLFFVGWNNDFIFIESLVKMVKNKKLKVFILSEKKKFFNFANIIEVKNGTLGNEFNLIGNILSNSKHDNQKYESIVNLFNKSNYPVFVPKIDNDNYELITSFFQILKNLNSKKPTKILNTLFSNNAPGFINACVTKCGYPNSICFSPFGPLYDPFEYNSFKLKDYKDLQIFVSCFDNNVKIELFKNNIFIGHPHFAQRSKVDVFIPTKIPGVDSQGVILRPDLSGIRKLKSIVKSGYPSLSDVLKMIGIKTYENK